jgi:hypothetical protein
VVTWNSRGLYDTHLGAGDYGYLELYGKSPSFVRRRILFHGIYLHQMVYSQQDLLI